MIKRGAASTRRGYPKNYIGRQVDQRLQEVVAPYRKQGTEALKVDSFDVKYYYKTPSTVVCTCQQTEVSVSDKAAGIPSTVLNPSSVVDPEEITIDYNRPLFGTKDDITSNDIASGNEFAIDDDEFVEHGIASVDSIFTASPDCGICYKTGFVPGYSLYGFDRMVLTTHHLNDASGFYVDKQTTPHSFQRVDGTGYVEFLINVPKYFKGCRYSIRNNTQVIAENIFVNDVPLSLNYLISNRGQQITIHIHALSFTHVVFEFDLGTDHVLANVAQLTTTVDWTLFDTIGNLNVILPMTIAQVSAGDVIGVTSRGIWLKITDVQYLRTSKDVNLDWSCTTRIVQPQEALKRIGVGFSLV